MKTVCKFRVMGLETTNCKVFEKVFEDDASFATVEGAEYTEYGTTRKYKSVFTGKRAQNVRLAAQYDTSNPEDVSFSEATPSGELKIYVSNPAVIGSFELDKDYYLHLIPV